MANEQAAQSIGLNLKAVLLLVIIAGVAFIGFWKLRAEYAAERTTIVRGPLHPLTAPITVDVVALMADLRARHFDKLETTLTSYESAAEKDVMHEANVVWAFRAFGRQDPALEAALQEWVRRSPNSYTAHLAHAMFLNGKGWDARGGKWASETSDQRFERMRQDFAAADQELRSALAINPKIAGAYALLVNQAQAGDGVSACVRIKEEALKQVPASFEIVHATMNCLRPRWGGSYGEMELLATQAQVHVRENPELAALKGFADLDRGELLVNAGKYDAAIAYFNRAIAEGGDYPGFYYSRGDALTRLNRYDEALEDLRRSNQLLPQAADVLETIALGLATTGKYREALTELDLAEAVEGPVPYEQQLRNQIVAVLNKHARDTGASGN